jgi:hypothetical protein
MKKRFFVFLILVVIAARGVFGQEQEDQEEKKGLWENILSNMGFAPGVEGAKFFINGGIGLELPWSSSVKHNMPPLSVSMDYVFPTTPLSLGGKLAFSTLKYLGESIDDCVNVDMAVRMAVHSKILEKIKNLDVTALALLGVDFATGDVYKVMRDAGYAYGFDGLYLGLGLGARYFFTKNIGAFLEADMKIIMKWSVGASAGLSLKF